MALTLVVNPGSSSKKYALYKNGTAVLTMYYERTPLGFELCTEVSQTRQTCEGVSADTFNEALSHCLAFAQSDGLVADLAQIETVVVRVVVPGTAFLRHCRIDADYLHRLKNQECSAPLHVPHTLREIAIVQKVLPQARLLAASDSVFHASIPSCARTYSIEPAVAAEHDLYRFGYHGLSVASVVRRHHAVVGYDPTRAVICHIGSGVSVTAVAAGKSVATSMGYSPSTGLPMASRAGDLDGGVVLALMRARSWRPLDTETYLSTRGGLCALSGTPDLRLVIEAAARCEQAAVQALDHYVHHLATAIAVATVSLGGIDSLIFTATAGERSSFLRARIAAKLGFLGVVLDEAKNELAHSKDAIISPQGSLVKVAVVRTDEMGEMALVATTV